MTWLLALLATTALAQNDDGIPLTVQVTDSHGVPIPTAVIRHTEEEIRHSVNAENGTWSGSVLYLPNGDELVFDRGFVVELEVSAPGYEARPVAYKMLKRRNEIVIALPALDLTNDYEEMEEPVIQFGRSTPIE